MEKFVKNTLEFVSTTRTGRLFCYPAFFMDIFLALGLCLLQYVLFLDINTSIRIAKARAFAKMRMKRFLTDFYIQESSKPNRKFASLRTTQLFQEKPKMAILAQFSESSPSPKIYNNNGHSNSRSGKEISNLTRGDSKYSHNKCQHLLSPSPYQPNKMKNQNLLVDSCIQSLTCYIENALSKDTLNFASDEIKKSIDTLRQYFESEINTNCESTGMLYATKDGLIGEIEDKISTKRSFVNASISQN